MTISPIDQLENKGAISPETLADLDAWFRGYVAAFKTGPVDFQENILLKEHHTLRVCREIKSLGEELGLDEDQLRLAETAALFHDIGRFEQYSRHHTFMDSKSENHAELGVRILDEKQVLRRLPEDLQKLLRRVIGYHNRAVLPAEETPTCLFYAKLLRDADKLDIWRVVTDYYRRIDERRNGTIELGLPDTPEISDEVVQDVMQQHIVDIAHIKTLNDFKLLQMGWIFDVNFAPTLRRVRERGYLQMIRSALPASARIDALYSLCCRRTDPPNDGR